MLASKSSSPIDPLPLSLFHKLAFILTPFIFNIINISLHSGIVPSSLKHAIIKPILKKQGLDIECLSNYRPISQLPFISKILERIVSKQLINYLNANSLFDTRQSAYRKFHSPETLLLSILDDFLNKLDNNSNIQLILLDLSAAFDTIDHSILIKRLEGIGIVGIPLAWVKSYLSERTFSIKIDNHYSSTCKMYYGVPQGSVLVPLLFSLYILPLKNIISNFPSVKYQIFSDDIQLYIELPVIANSSDNVALIDCINMVRNWFLQNSLMLNMNKTQLLNISRTSSVFPSVVIDSITIVPCNNVKNLGFIFDDKLNYSDQIANVCKSTNYQLYKIRSIRKFLPFRISKMLIESLVMSRINYCCSLYYGLPATSTKSLE